MSKLRFSAAAILPKKWPKLAMLADRISEARRIIEAQQAQLMKLQASGQSTFEAEGALRIYVSSLLHLLARAEKLQEEAKALKGETKRVNH
jgi:hypothetical protein